MLNRMPMRHLTTAPAFVLALSLGCGSSGAGGNAGGGDGGQPVTGDGGQSSGECRSLAPLCSTLPIDELRTIFGAPALVATTGNDDVAPGGPVESCDYKQDTSDLYVSFRVQYLCKNAGAARAQQDFADVRALAGTTDDVAVSGLGDEAYWSYTSTETVPYVWGYLSARQGNVIVTLGSYGQNVPGIPDATPIAASAAKEHATAAVRAVLAAVQAN